MYIEDRVVDDYVLNYEKYERTMKTIQKRFSTYGYKRVTTSAFEQYDLYSKVNSSTNQSEMIKVIDRNGQVLVLRPDVTIPITRKLAEEFSELPNELRYFYVQDVFRQGDSENLRIESTQAGIEYFGESSSEVEAEVIALACHTLQDLGFVDVKIEIGHANFFKQLIEDIDLTPRQLNELKSLVQAKNIVDIEAFLENLEIDKEVREAINAIPFLYGDPIEISEKARALVSAKQSHEILDYLMSIYEILTVYGLQDSIVMDLGLINHMDYYSDIIFQGFVENLGKPVLMGGRYDNLGTVFGATLPAIGFACEVDALVEASSREGMSSPKPIDMTVIYDDLSLKKSIALANELRERNYSVLTVPARKASDCQTKSIYTIKIEEDRKSFSFKENEQPFKDIHELLKLMSGPKGRG